jgi:uncharacterized protein YxeA
MKINKSGLYISKKYWLLSLISISNMVFASAVTLINDAKTGRYIQSNTETPRNFKVIAPGYRAEDKNRGMHYFDEYGINIYEEKGRRKTATVNLKFPGHERGYYDVYHASILVRSITTQENPNCPDTKTEYVLSLVTKGVILEKSIDYINKIYETIYAGDKNFDVRVCMKQ